MNAKEVTTATFEAEVLKATKPTIVDFRAEWCGPCNMLGPELDAIAQARQDLAVVQVDVDKSTDLAAQFGITSIPAVLLFKDGQLAGRTVGFMPGAQLLSELGL